MYLPRLLEKALAAASRGFPAVVVTGPRQAGKSTLLQHFLKGRKGTLLSLEDPRVRGLLAANGADYLASLPRPVILDEIQYYPDVTIYVKMLVDKDRRPGQWYLTGSQQFAVMRHVSESMAGRVAVLALPPIQLKERRSIPSLASFVTGSTYPEPLTKKRINTPLWYSSYLQTYLERDVRTQLGVTDLRDFEQLMRLLAARTSQVLNYTALAGPLGVSVPTVKRWVSVLEASYLVHLLPPYFENFGKRILKAPKIYFLDVGLVSFLLGLDEASAALNGPMAGAL
ncbi:MAG: ATP-binding protein, partial [bacterium]